MPSWYIYTHTDWGTQGGLMVILYCGALVQWLYGSLLKMELKTWMDYLGVAGSSVLAQA